MNCQKKSLKTLVTRDEVRCTTVYRLSGRLIGNRDGYQFLDQARDQLSPILPNLVLDFGGISLINSAGIGILAALGMAARQAGGQVSLIGVTEKISRNLCNVFPNGVLTLVDPCGP